MIGLFGLLCAAGFARRAAGRGAAWLTLLLLLTAYNLWKLFGWPYVDLAVMTYGALGMVALERYRATRGMGWVVALGVIGGLALGVKYTAGALLIAFGFAVLVTAPRRVIRNGLIMGAAAGLLFAPWALRAWLHYGNPVYPFLFGGLNWDALRSDLFDFSDQGLMLRGQAWQAAVLPLSATIFGLDRIGGFGFTANPWLLTTPLFLPIVWRWLKDSARAAAWTLILLLLGLYAVWAVTALTSAVGMQTRLMIMILPVSAAAGAIALVGLKAMPRKPLDLRFMVTVLLVLTTCLSLLDMGRTLLREQPLAYLFGRASVDDYLYANTGAHYNAMKALRALPDGATVRFILEPRGLYCPETVTCIADVLLDHWLRPAVTGRTPDEIMRAYRAAGDDYWLVWDTAIDEHREAFAQYDALIAPLPEAIAAHMTPVWTDGLRYSIYTWR